MKPRPVLQVVPRDVAGLLPPHDLNLEAVVLSGCLVDVARVGPAGEKIAGGFARIRDLLTREDFYNPAHGWIWAALEALASSEEGIIDIALVGAWLREQQRLAMVGGVGYLMQIADATPAPQNIEQQAMVVARLARRRRFIGDLQLSVAEGYGVVASEDDWCDEVVTRLSRRSQEARLSAGMHIGAAMRAAIETIGEGPGTIAAEAITTGIRALDDDTVGGHHRKTLTLISGITGRGKSAFTGSLEVAAAVARNSVVVFQLEDSKENLSLRLACQIGRVDATRVRKGTLDPEENVRLLRAAGWIQNLPLMIDDTKKLTVAAVESRAARYAADLERRHKTRLGLVVVDYLQLLRTASEDEDLRARELSGVAEGLYHMSERLDVAVIALSQVNADGLIAESRGILNHAQNWWDIEREVKRGKMPTGDADVARITIKKQRHGPSPVTVPLWFHRSIVLFSDEERLDQERFAFDEPLQ